MLSVVASLPYHLKPIPLHLGEAGGCRTLSLLTQQQAAEAQRRIPPTLWSLVTLSPSRAVSCPDSQRRAQSGMLEEDRASITSHPQMLREVCLDERVVGCSKPPSHVPPFATRPVSLALSWKVRTRPLPPHPPTSSSQDMIGFLACSSAPPLGLTTSPTSLSVNTLLSRWLCASVGARQPLPPLAEKRLSESRQSNQSLLSCVLE